MAPSLATAATLLLATTATAWPNPFASAPIYASKNPLYLFTFGDSYSQTGFNISLGTPSSSNPIGYPPFPGWTTSGTLNWVDFLVAEYNRTLVLSYNFASGGATTDASIVAGFEPYPQVLSLVNQVDEFATATNEELKSVPWTGENSLFGIWIGVNDVGNSYWLSNETAVIDAIMAVRLEEMTKLYNAGARKFALLSVPPINRTPAMLAESSSARTTEKSVIKMYNSALSAQASSFQSSHHGSSVQIVDTQSPFKEALNHPHKYGADNATCYYDSATGSDCLWWNNYHPGVAIHKLVAESVAGVVGWPWFK